MLYEANKPVKRQRQIVSSEDESQDDNSAAAVRRGTRNRNQISYQSMLSDLSENEATATQDRKGKEDSDFSLINIDSD